MNARAHKPCGITALAFAGAFAAAGCGGGARDVEPVDVTSVRIEMAALANDDRPSRVDLVRVSDEATFKALLKMNTRNWFAGERESFAAANPDAQIEQWEIVPGTQSGPHDTAVFDDLAAVIMCEIHNMDAAQRVTVEGAIGIIISDQGCALREE